MNKGQGNWCTFKLYGMMDEKIFLNNIFFCITQDCQVNLPRNEVKTFFIANKIRFLFNFGSSCRFFSVFTCVKGCFFKGCLGVSVYEHVRFYAKEAFQMSLKGDLGHFLYMISRVLHTNLFNKQISTWFFFKILIILKQLLPISVNGSDLQLYVCRMTRNFFEMIFLFSFEY